MSQRMTMDEVLKEYGVPQLRLYIDVDDIDRYLSGELDTVGEIYAFPEDIKSYQE